MTYYLAAEDDSFWRVRTRIYWFAVAACALTVLIVSALDLFGKLSEPIGVGGYVALYGSILIWLASGAYWWSCKAVGFEVYGDRIIIIRQRSKTVIPMNRIWDIKPVTLSSLALVWTRILGVQPCSSHGKLWSRTTGYAVVASSNNRKNVLIISDPNYVVGPDDPDSFIRQVRQALDD